MTNSNPIISAIAAPARNLRAITKFAGILALAGLALAGLPADALAAETAKLDSGDTAWMLTATALVLLMTVPGVALFYGGMVRKRNVLTIVM